MKNLQQLLPMSSLKQFAGRLVSQGTGTLFNGIAFVVLARVLTVSEFGFLAWTMAFAAVVGTATLLGIDVVLVRQYAIVGREESAKAFKASLLPGAVISLVAGGLGVLASPGDFYINSSHLFFFLTSTTLWWGMTGLIGAWNQCETTKLRYFFSAVVLRSSSQVAGALALMFGEHNFTFYTNVRTSVNIVLIIASLILHKDLLRHGSWTSKGLFYFGGFSLSIFLSRLMMASGRLLERMTIEFFLGLEKLGVFAFYQQCSGHIMDPVVRATKDGITTNIMKSHAGQKMSTPSKLLVIAQVLAPLGAGFLFAIFSNPLISIVSANYLRPDTPLLVLTAALLPFLGICEWLITTKYYVTMNGRAVILLGVLSLALRISGLTLGSISQGVLGSMVGLAGGSALWSLIMLCLWKFTKSESTEEAVVTTVKLAERVETTSPDARAGGTLIS